MNDCSCTVIVFSKDRALQLHALLTSYYDQVHPAQSVQVLYTTSGHTEQQSYDSVIEYFPHIRFVKQSDFHSDLIELLSVSQSGAVMFLVDDMLFINPVDLSVLCRQDLSETVPSLRLGQSLSYNFPYQWPQRPPTLYAAGGGKFTFQWQQGELDWHYPLSLDGHVYSRTEILSLARRIHFYSPNTFEYALQRFAPFFMTRRGLCYAQPRTVNLPWNRVQNEFENECGDVGTNELLARWNNGEQLDTRRYYGCNVSSAHQDMPPVFMPRAAPGH